MVIDIKNAPHYNWGNACDSWVLADTNGLSVKQESMPPGTKEQRHYHVSAQQFFFILEGTAAFYAGDEKKTIHAQQGILIEAETPHYIANESDKKLTFLVISQPSTNNDRINVAI